MVNLETLTRAIEYELEKSHQHLKLPQQPKYTFNYFHNRFCNERIQEKELGIAVRADGKICNFVKGDYESITLDYDGIKNSYDRYGELHFTHNHPRESGRIVAECLSDGDVANLFRQIVTWDKETGEIMHVYPFKSMSCESANGSRMTLVRGDKFKMENYTNVMELQKELWNYWDSYQENYYNAKMNGQLPKSTSDFSSWDEYNAYAHNEAIKKLGRFEQTPEFRDLKKRFRKLDCRLTYDYPFPYRIQ